MGAGGERAVALTRKEIRKLHNFRTLREKYKSLGTTYFPALANSFFVSDFGIPPISPEPRLLDRGFEPVRGFKSTDSVVDLAPGSSHPLPLLSTPQVFWTLSEEFYRI